MNVNEITHRIIGAAIEVHKETGPGLLESAYKACFLIQLKSDGLKVRREVAVPLFYKGVDVGVGYRLDLLVEETIVVEVKAVERVDPVFKAQLITYLKLARHPAGLLINFNVPQLIQGVHRTTAGPPDAMYRAWRGEVADGAEDPEGIIQRVKEIKSSIP